MRYAEELEILRRVKLPKMYRIRQNFTAPRVEDIAGTVRSELKREEVQNRIKPGSRVAIGVGSRGIANLAEVVRTVVEVIRQRGAEPFITPAMGSHGGATAEGQKEVLAGYNITEENVGAPVEATMETVRLGEVGDIPVHFDRLAAEADCFVPVNRVKLHTDFRAPVESGIMKMLAIGWGNQQGASLIHSCGVRGLEQIAEVAETILAHSNSTMAFGVALVENAMDETARIRAVLPEGLREQEAELLAEARRLFPRFPVDSFDLLVVDEIGKDISGAGMDTNVLGRLLIRGEKEPSDPEIFRIVALDLTPDSHGNAIGIGLADLITERLYRKIDLPALRANVVTSSFLERGKIPLPLPTDCECIKAALASCWHVQPERARIIRIKNTLELSEMEVSGPVKNDLESREDIELRSGARDWPFDAAGNLF